MSPRIPRIHHASVPLALPLTLRALGRGFHVVPDEEIERAPSSATPIDYAPLSKAARDIATWLLAVARSRTTDPLDHTAIDRVERAVRFAFASHAPGGARPVTRLDVTEEDLLTVAGILIDAFEIDLGVSGLGSIVGSVYDAADGDPDRLWDAFADAIADRAVRELVAATRARPTSRVMRVVPVVVRRPRIADQAALDDLTSHR
ncbi:MAG: hypothetical protein HS111_06870 [Kofleriaceae bacterium]|nr:hypothetical protein [Kofleriaceae bacterium]MCL4225586.1 hypothetical protein [Myxococcales bacterium]